VTWPRKFCAILSDKSLRRGMVRARATTRLLWTP